MTENEMKEVEELKNALVIIGEPIDWDKTARINYENNIRKIPDGAVVLTQEEQEEFRSGEKTYSYKDVAERKDIYVEDKFIICFHLAIENARKETASEILQVLLQYGDRDEALRRHILDIADEYGVEVEE